MRFSAPRSTSPSPVRRQYRGRSTFGVPSDSSEDEPDTSDSVSVSSSSTDSFFYASESDIPPPPPRPERPRRSLAEQHYMEDVVASIRLRVTHHDPYEEWEQETKRDAFRSARIEHSMSRTQCRKDKRKAHADESKRRALVYEKQVEEVQSQLATLDLQRKAEELELKERWKERNQQLWKRINGVIKSEEDKLRVKLEAERKKKEEEERKRREEEERRRQEEERKRNEEEKRRQEEEGRRRQKEREEQEKLQQLEAEKQRAEQEQAEEQQRKALGFTTAMEDWKRARDTLKSLKTGPMRIVKDDRALKSVWSAGRRAMNPKIGQLTNDAQSITRISQQLVDIVRPSPSYPSDVYLALLSSLAKAILLQAETEVTAEKRSAGPLAQVAANLLGELEGFADIFWAKLCQRTGGWPVPVVVPSSDSDGKPFDETQRAKALGYRQDESLGDYTTRVSGMMRVYFHILCAPVSRPLDPIFRLPRYWTYFSRMLLQPQLLQTSVAPQVMHAGLDVGGVEARDIWGQQWIKLLSLLYEGVTTGLKGSNQRLIGGQTPEGIAARVRVQLEIERIMSSS
ncbi:hypothetical protein AcW1_009921 [Taiwanofungus camphoratus]|nr:hypothetical protein AcV7_005272 [Antrodia cinnamomea]KAI0946468.1 hypothetical protein AcW1_009921 [Antrodia cinnamomea]